MGQMIIMRNYEEPEAGDSRHAWNPDNDIEVNEMRGLFTRMRTAGHIAYTVDANGVAGEVIREFDPRAGKIIMRPPVAGG